jgi:hypothetical protein
MTTENFSLNFKESKTEIKTYISFYPESSPIKLDLSGPINGLSFGVSFL